MRDVVDGARDLERALAPGQRERAARARGAGVLGDEGRPVRSGQVVGDALRGEVVLQHVAHLDLGLQVAGLAQLVPRHGVEVEARGGGGVGVEERIGVVEDVAGRVAIDDRAHAGRVVQAQLAKLAHRDDLVVDRDVVVVQRRVVGLVRLQDDAQRERLRALGLEVRRRQLQLLQRDVAGVQHAGRRAGDGAAVRIGGRQGAVGAVDRIVQVADEARRGAGVSGLGGVRRPEALAERSAQRELARGRELEAGLGRHRPAVAVVVVGTRRGVELQRLQHRRHQLRVGRGDRLLALGERVDADALFAVDERRREQLVQLAMGEIEARAHPERAARQVGQVARSAHAREGQVVAGRRLGLRRDLRQHGRGVGAAHLVGVVVQRVLQRREVDVVVEAGPGGHAREAHRGIEVPGAERALELAHEAVGVRQRLLGQRSDVEEVVHQRRGGARGVAGVVGRHGQHERELAGKGRGRRGARAEVEQVDAAAVAARAHARGVGVVVDADLARLAAQHRRLDVGLPVVAQLLRVAGHDVEVGRRRLQRHVGVAVAALVGGGLRLRAAGVGVVGGAGPVDEVAGAAARAAGRAGNGARPRALREVDPAVGRPVGARQVRPLAQQDVVLVARLERDVGVLAVGVEAAPARGQASVRGGAVALAADARLGADRGAGDALLQNHVDHAGDGVRTVDRRRAVLEHLDTLDGAHRDRGDVDEVALAVVGHRVRRHAVAVDEHQRGTDREPAQGHAAAARGERAGRGLRQRAHVVGGDVVQHVGDAGVAGLLDVLGGQHLHRAGRLGVGAAHVRPRDGHLLRRGDRNRVLCPRLGAPAGKRRDDERGAPVDRMTQGSLHGSLLDLDSSWTWQ